MAEKIGLICEGGGTKAAYTCGVLQCFLDYDIEFFKFLNLQIYYNLL